MNSVFLCRNQYPKGISKGDKDNLRRQCKKSWKGEGDEDWWKICAKTKKDAFSSHVMLGLKVKKKVYLL